MYNLPFYYYYSAICSESVLPLCFVLLLLLFSENHIYVYFNSLVAVWEDPSTARKTALQTGICNMYIKSEAAL